MKAAIVVGCDTYTAPIPGLRYASNDANRVAAMLEAACGVPAENIWLLSTPAADDITAEVPGQTNWSAPTFTGLLRALNGGGQSPPTNVETLFFYFSGHGYHAEADGTQYLLLSDSLAEDLSRTALSMQTVVAKLQAWNPRHLVMFVDACREVVADSRTIGADRFEINSHDPHARGTLGIDAAALLPSGNITFSSCSSGQRSYELPVISGGIFTQILCEAFSDTGRCRTLHELNAYLRRRVPAMCRLHGKPEQNPTARLEPVEVLDLEVVSEARRNAWRDGVSVGAERRPAAVPQTPLVGLRPYLALDFGTCSTLTRVLDADGVMHVVPDADGHAEVPSVVSFDENWDYVVGSRAVALDAVRPEGTVWYPKRTLGGPSEFNVFDRSLPAEFVCSLVLRHARRNAEEFLGTPVESVLAAYPASFTIAQSNALRRAFELADLDVQRFVPEPSVDGYLTPETPFRDMKKTLVVDLGGGTLDVAIVEHSEGVVEVRATHGDGRLGGVDYDDALIDDLTRLVTTSNAGAAVTPYQLKTVTNEARRAKHVLSSQDTCDIYIPGTADHGGDIPDVHQRIDREFFERITEPLNRRLAAAVTSVVRESLFDPRRPDAVPADADVTSTLRELHAVVLCGQATRVPSLISTIESLSPALIVKDHERDAVVRGLAQQVGVLTGLRKDLLLLDTQQSGIAILVSDKSGPVSGAILSPDDDLNTRQWTLLQKGASIPCTVKTHLTPQTPDPDQTLRLRIVENKSLWELDAPHHVGVVELALPSAGVELTIDVDANAMITLTLSTPAHDSPTDASTTSPAQIGSTRKIVLNRVTPPPGCESIFDQRLTGSIDEASPTPA